MTWTFSVVDGFDHYAPADAGRKWTAVVGAFTNVAGPYHGNAARFEGGGNYLDLGRGIGRRSIGAACWLRLDGSTWGATEHVCPVQLVNGSGTTGVRQSLWVHADGSVSLRRGTDGGDLLVASAAGVFPFGEWVYVEYASALSVDADGRCDLRLNGTEACSATGLQTTTTAFAADVRWGNCLADGNGVRLDLDDLAQALSTSLSLVEPDPPPWTGPHAVLTLFPVGPGDLAEFTPEGEEENWACCAEAQGDGDATYVTPGAVGTPTDLYAMSPPSSPIPALPDDAQVLALHRQEPDSPGTGSVRLRYVDEDDVEQDLDLALTVFMGTAYWYDVQVLDATQSALETLQLGWASLPGALFRGSQLCVELWYPLPAAGGQRWSAAWTRV